MRSSSARGRTASRRPSRSPRRAAPCSCSKPRRDDRRRHAHGGAHAARASGTTSARPIHPLALASPFLRTLPLARARARVRPPRDSRSRIRSTTAPPRRAAPLARRDGRRPRRRRRAYRTLMQPLAAAWEPLLEDLLGPLRPPRHPLADARFARSGLRSATGLGPLALRGRARARAARRQRRALHAAARRRSTTAGFGLMLMMLGHAVGWPVAVGGSQAIADALASLLRSLGGEIETGRRGALARRACAASRAVLFDLTPRQLLAIAGDDAAARATGGRSRRYRYGPGVFKLDYALDGPVPWTAPECRRAGTVHLGGTLDEIAQRARPRSRAAGTRRARSCSSRSRASSTRPARPRGAHTLWAYCHVPNGSAVDATRRDRGSDRALRARLPRSDPRAQRHGPRRRCRPTTRTTSAATSTAARPICASCSRGPSRGRVPYATPNPRSSSARRRRRRAEACTGCPAGTPPAPPCAAPCAERETHRSCLAVRLPADAEMHRRRPADERQARSRGASRGIGGGARPDLASRPTGGSRPRSGRSTTTSTSGCCSLDGAIRDAVRRARTSSACSGAAPGRRRRSTRPAEPDRPRRPCGLPRVRGRSARRAAPSQVDYRVHGLDGTLALDSRARVARAAGRRHRALRRHPLRHHPAARGRGPTCALALADLAEANAELDAAAARRSSLP